MLNKKAIVAFSFGAAFVAGLAFATPAMAGPLDGSDFQAPAPSALDGFIKIPSDYAKTVTPVSYTHLTLPTTERV